MDVADILVVGLRPFERRPIMLNPNQEYSSALKVYNPFSKRF